MYIPKFETHIPKFGTYIPNFGMEIFCKRKNFLFYREKLFLHYLDFHFAAFVNDADILLEFGRLAMSIQRGLIGPGFYNAENIGAGSAFETIVSNASGMML